MDSYYNKESNQMLTIFKSVHPEWIITPNFRCPTCGRLNCCQSHHWANEKWLTGGKGATMISAMAFSDTPLREKLKAEGLWIKP
jgi:hypothetical protein